MRHSALLTAAALIALPLAAQQRDSVRATPPGTPRGMMGMGMRQGMQGEGMGGMHRLHAFMPAALIEHEAHLNLSSQQVTRLEQLRDAAKAAHDAAQGQAQAHMQEMMRALTAATPDSGQVRAHFVAHHEAMGQAHWAMLRSALQARAVLTDAQRQWMEGWAAAMAQHQQHEGMVGMMQGQGMGPGHDGHTPGQPQPRRPPNQ
jgi:Spy/CpxP family protein refolding chaperone